MKEEHVKGTAKDIAGKVQQKTGELTGSEKQQLKGVKKQVEGKVEKAVGDVKEAFDKSKETGKVGWVLLWLLGVPIPVLFVLFLLRGCT
jgi:uncharacterized protein YjbJ (UPF0337 family)